LRRILIWRNLMRRLLLPVILLTNACITKPPAVEVKIDPALKTLVPADTILMAGVRFEALLKTPLYQKYFADRPIPELDELCRKTGIDRRKDLWELLFISNGREGVLLGRGKFADQEQLKPGSGEQRSVYKGYSLIGDGRVAILFVSPTTAALGAVPALHSLVDQRQKSTGPPASLAALLREIPPDAQVWAAYTGGPAKLPFDKNSNWGNLNRLLIAAQSGAAHADLSTGFKATAQATFSTVQAAQQAHDALQGLAGFARLSLRPGQGDLAAALERIQVTQDQQRVKVQADLPQELADELLKTLR
jgi:hypothetical protein